MRIVFAGTPEFGIPSLKALAQVHEIVGIYTQPDRPAGRGRKIQASCIKEWGIQNHIPIYQPLNFKDPTAVSELDKLKPDVMVVIAYGLILPHSILNLPKFGCVNVHASLLPRWRGASPIQHAILYGDKESGVSIMQMDKGMDTGPVYTEVKCPIHPADTANDLHDRLATMSVEPLLHTLNGLSAGTIKAKPQEDALATYAPKINKQDALIKWDKPANEINQQIRAFNPWPVAYTSNYHSLLKVYEAEIVERSTIKKPGIILAIDKNGLLISTGENDLLVKKIQFPGGKVLTVQQWLNANNKELQIGDILGQDSQ